MSSAAPGGSGAGQREWRLPADVSGFVGRAAELARLTALLRESRLVTVTGPGGVGKTRLALRAAADHAAGGAACFPDGGCLTELSRLTDPELLPGAIAGSLGVPDTGARSPLAAVLGQLRGARLLLILDTCEHLTGGCARFAAQVLRETETVTILTTSRQPLHLPGEQVLRIGPLPVPDSPADTGDSVDLFAQRAAAAHPGFAVTAANLPDVVRLCQRLDGLPLAIELAALRVRALPLAVLGRRADAGLATLTGSQRGTVARHQTLRAAIEWSYRLCTPAERAVWRRLSVIGGSFGLAAAADVAAGADVPASQVGQVLAALVDKSVVLATDGDRYRLPGPVREYAADEYPQVGQETAGGSPHPLAAAAAPWAGPALPGRDGQGDAGDTIAADGLTSRERQIAALVASGLSNQEIANRLVISRRTVDAHICHIFGKLGVSSRVQLTLWLHERGRVPRPRVSESAAVLPMS